MFNQFSVYWYDDADRQYEEKRFVSAQEAMAAVKRLTQGPAALLGIVQRVIVTDGDDYTSFDWRKDKGVIFPPKEQTTA